MGTNGQPIGWDDPTQPVETVHVVEDDPAIQGLFQQIANLEGFAVELHSRAESYLQSWRDEPGCLVLDLNLPDRSGLDVLRELAAHGCQVPVVFISGIARVSEAVSALKLGSIDFVEKPFALADMIAAIRRALQADRDRRQRQREAASLRSRLDTLTPREREVMELVVEGLPNKTIATRLGVSPKTIEVHRAHVMQKTRAESLADLVKLAIAARRAGAAAGEPALSGRSL